MRPAAVFLALGLVLGLGLAQLLGPARAGDPPELTRRFEHPKGMAYVWWGFPKDKPIHEITFRFRIPRDYPKRDGIYFALAQGKILDPKVENPDPGFYFGFQTITQGRGRGIIFSRWGTRDLENARTAEKGWSQSSGHEGDFIGVRNFFPWKEGDYSARLARTERDEVGSWYGVWFTHLRSKQEYYGGSLRFPGDAAIDPSFGSWIEIYSGVNRPIDIAPFRVELQVPRANGKPAETAKTDYGKLPNSNVHFKAKKKTFVIDIGGKTKRKDAKGKKIP